MRINVYAIKFADEGVKNQEDFVKTYPDVKYKLSFIDREHVLLLVAENLKQVANFMEKNKIDVGEIICFGEVPYLPEIANNT